MSGGVGLRPLGRFSMEPALSIKVSNEMLNQEVTSKVEDEFGVSRDGIATIRQMKNGKFRLLVNQNEVIGTYARRRDAVRGATRKGLTVA